MDGAVSPGLLSGLLVKCRAEVAYYQKRGSKMGDYEQLAAAGRAEFAQEIIDTIERQTS